MKIVTVAKFEIEWWRSLLVTKSPVSVIKTGLQVGCIAYIFCQILYFKDNYIGVGV